MTDFRKITGVFGNEAAREAVLSLLRDMAPGQEFLLPYPVLEELWPTPPINQRDDYLEAPDRMQQWALSNGYAIRLFNQPLTLQVAVHLKSKL